MTSYRVAVLRGGVSPQYEESLHSGGIVLNALRESEGYQPVDILVDSNGDWFRNGRKATIHKALQDVDVVFPVMPGEYGGDGQLQRQLQMLGKKYVGSDRLSSVLCSNKEYTKKIMDEEDVLQPYSIILVEDNYVLDEVREIFRSFPQPSVVKPLSCESSCGVTVARGFEEFKHAIDRAFRYGTKILIEEYIRGREVSSGVIEDFRNQQLYTLLPVEFCEGGLQCPSRFTDKERSEIMRVAKLAHQKLGASNYSKTDMIVTPKGVYFLEINTAPNLAIESPFMTGLSGAGISPNEFVSHCVYQTLVS